MEVFQPLVAFYKAIDEDARIGSTHISLYFTLLRHWNCNQCENPFLISRDEVMKNAKINSRHTYNKCMNELHEYGYIIYTASSSPLIKSKVHLKYL